MQWTVVIIELVVLSTTILLISTSYLEGEIDSILMKEKDFFFFYPLTLSMSKQSKALIVLS